VKDFFYDEMLPWIHYVPVKTDLSDLKEKFDWAEANPERSRLIAQEATSFGEYLFSSKYMDELYDELFTKYLGSVVNAYQPNDGMTWEQSLQHYHETGHEIVQLSQCDEAYCEIEARGVTNTFFYRQIA
jgi:adenylate kinase family enzyme